MLCQAPLHRRIRQRWSPASFGSARISLRTGQADEFLHCIKLSLLSFDNGALFLNNGLLLVDGVDQNCRDLRVLNALDFARRVPRCQQRLDLFNFFGREVIVAQSAVFPGKSDWVKYWVSPSQRSAA